MAIVQQITYASAEVRGQLAALRKMGNSRDAGCSGDLLPPSPPAEKTTASQDQAGKARRRRWGRVRQQFRA
jgi:hypothetical protein